MVRYADDLVALCLSREQAEEVKMRLAGVVDARGLAFNEDKTRVVHLDEGFDFLGFNVRRYQDKLLIKPSKAAIQRIRERLAAEMRSLQGTNVVAVIKRLNPIIRGWSAYYRSVVSSEAFATLDSYVWTLTYQWACAATRTKRGTGLSTSTSGRSTGPGRTAGCSATAHSGAYLLKFTWTRIVRHQMVPGAASPDDPTLAEYWARRRQRQPPPLDGLSLRLLQAQRGRCAACGGLLVHVDREPQASRNGNSGSRRPAKRSAKRRPRTSGDLARWTNPSHTVLSTPTVGRGPWPPPPRRPTVSSARCDLGLLEPDAVKVARPVLRGPRRSNALGLPDCTSR